MINFIDTQEWVPIHTLPGFEAAIEYYVNKDGDILSTKGKEPKLKKHGKHSAGYPLTSLTQRIGKGKVITCCVHKIVAFAFLGPPPTPYGAGKGCSMVDHIEEDKTNCKASNLRWVTRSENNNKFNYQLRPKNTPEQAAAAKERQRIAKRDYMRRLREKQKAVKIEESDT